MTNSMETRTEEIRPVGESPAGSPEIKAGAATPAQKRRGPARVTTALLIEELVRGMSPRKLAEKYGLPMCVLRRRITSPGARRLIQTLQELSRVQMRAMRAEMGPQAVGELMGLAEDTTQKPDVRLRGCLGVIAAARQAAEADRPGARPAAPAPEQAQDAEPACDMERLMAKAAEIVLAEEEAERRARDAAPAPGGGGGRKAVVGEWELGTKLNELIS